MRLLIIGSGAIGTTLAEAIQDMDEFDIFYITDKNEERAKKIAARCKKAKFISPTRTPSKLSAASCSGTATVAQNSPLALDK